MTLPASGRIAVYTEPNTPFQVQDFPIRAPRADEALGQGQHVHHLPFGHSFIPRPSP